MDDLIEIDPIQDQLNQVVVAVALLMARAMDFELQYLVHQVGIDCFHVRQAAEAANRIVVRCGRLIDDVRSYEHYDRQRRQQNAKANNNDRDDDAVDF